MTALYPTDTSQAPTDLQARYRLLRETEQLVIEQFPLALEKGDIENARQLYEQLQEALNAFRAEKTKSYVELPDGRVLHLTEYEVLQSFSKTNRLELHKVLEKITISIGAVTRADFSQMGIRTLKGLSGLTQIEGLDVSWNNNLQSLEDLPVSNLQTLRAYNCSLRGNLLELERATQLVRLVIFGNPELTSLSGLPTGALKYLYARQCGLTGELPELLKATKLEVLRIPGNPNLDPDVLQKIVDTLRTNHRLRDIEI